MTRTPDPLEPTSLPGAARPHTPAELLQALPVVISQVYDEADRRLRAQLLECLLRPFGPLALAAVACGAFGAFVQRQGWQQLSVPLDDASLRFSDEQIRELASLALQIDPGVLAQLDSVLTSQPRPRPSPDMPRFDAPPAALSDALPPLQ
jgi:hypothetical protein